MARQKKVKITEFSNVIEDILAEYADDVNEETPGIVREVAEYTRNEIISNIAQQGIGGTKYKNSIEINIQKGKTLASAIIHSPKHYQLTHLLEYGHTIVAHGKTYGATRAFPHWAPAEKAGVEKFEREIKEAVQK